MSLRPISRPMAAILRDNDPDVSFLTLMTRAVSESPAERERGIRDWAERNDYILFPPRAEAEGKDLDPSWAGATEQKEEGV